MYPSQRYNLGKSMNSQTHVLFYYITEIALLILAGADSSDSDLGYGAVTDYHECYVNRLYLREWNKDPPSDLDPAKADAATRQQICDEISQSGVFARYGKHAFSVEEVYTDVRLENPSNMLFRFSQMQLTTIDSNPYKERSFEFLKSDDVTSFRGTHYYPCKRTEHVFVCLLKQKYFNMVFPFYVSKAYDAHRGKYAHRYLFMADERSLHDIVMLVDRGAQPVLPPDFNVELRYLELRQQHKPVSAYWLDPVCKLNAGDISENQLFRLCTIVLSSRYFNNRVAYPRRIIQFHPTHVEKEISFQTEEGSAKSDGKQFHELMVRCWGSKGEPPDVSDELYYVSRAYITHQVFVLVQDSFTGKVYLENMFYDVSLVETA